MTFVEQKYDLYSDRFRTDTYATFADGATPIWVVTRYEDAVAVLLDDERFVRDPSLALTAEERVAYDVGMPESLLFIDNHMLNKDGDDHRRLRRLVTKAFTPRMVERLRPRIQQIADELIDAVAARGEMELVEDFAFPLPITVIVELLGIPPADRDSFREWSAALVTPALDPEGMVRFGQLVDEFVAYLRDLFAKRRTEPGDDLTSALLQAEESGDMLSEPELFSMVVLLIVAGHETTVSLIGNAVLALLRQPDQLARLARSPRHLGFGRGSHYCLGAPLARLEGEVALTTLLRRLPGIRLAVTREELRWRPVPLFRSLASLPVAW